VQSFIPLLKQLPLLFFEIAGSSFEADLLGLSPEDAISKLLSVIVRMPHEIHGKKLVNKCELPASVSPS
jgi:hypothetical protein